MGLDPSHERHFTARSEAEPLATLVVRLGKHTANASTGLSPIFFTQGQANFVISILTHSNRAECRDRSTPGTNRLCLFGCRSSAPTRSADIDDLTVVAQALP